MRLVTQAKLKEALESRDMAIQNLLKRYWELNHAHQRLLAHLGLTDIEVPAKFMLVGKKDKQE